MRRVVSVWFPNWATDRLRRHGAAPPAEEPLVTRRHDGRRLVVGSADQAARAAGLRPGTPLAQAQAMIPGLHIAAEDMAGDAEALARMAAWCLRWAPLSCADPPDGIWIDTTGCDHLHGGEAEMLHGMLHRLQGAGYTARLALADTAGAAHALARHGDDHGHGHRGIMLCPPGGHRAAIAPLPVMALRIAPDTGARLRRLGLETVGQLITTARAPLARRFGTGLLQRLDQALGREREPIAYAFPPDLVQHRLAFLEPILTADAMAQGIAVLARAICEQLHAAGHGARQLDLVFERVDGSLQSIRIGTAAPNRDPAHLARLLRERIEQVDPGLGVEAMRLVVPLSEPAAMRQIHAGLAAEAAAEPAPDAGIAPLIDRLSNRFGARRVFWVAPVESDVPERGLRRVAASTGGPQPALPALLPRPVRLLPRPEPISVIALLPDEPPALFTWRHVRHRIHRADGPERIHGEWWRRDAENTALRDYWRVEDEAGQRFWLFRHGDGTNPQTGDLRWYLHGFF